MSRPWGVTRFCASSAPSARRRSSAWFHAARGGEVGQGSAAGSAEPQSAAASATGARSAWRISGGADGARRRSSASLQSRRQKPGPRRPARPRRWSARSRVTATVSRCDIPVSGEKRETRARPVSTTDSIPSIVSEDSAIDVARTTLRRPGGEGRSAASCSARVSAAKSGISSTSGPRRDSSSSRAAVRISPSPGRNASTDPRRSESARRTPAAARAATDGSVLRSSHAVSTGNIRPSARTTGAGAAPVPPRWRATASASSVADMTRTRRSGRRPRRTSSASASPKSAWRERSWNSSKTTSPASASSGSERIRRERSPSVRTSIRVSRDVFRSRRMW